MGKKVKTTPTRSRLIKRLLLAAVALTFCLQVRAANDVILTGRNIISMAFDDRNIEAMATRRVQPAYPPMAQKYKIEGTVVVQLSVGGDGKVSKAEFVRGHNIFRSVSLDAAKRWEFRAPSEGALEGTVQFSFKLNN
jgi:TonB family protein